MPIPSVDYRQHSPRHLPRVALAVLDSTGIAQSVNDPRAGLSLVRICEDVVDLLAVGLAGQIDIAVIDTAVAHMERLILQQLDRAGVAGVLLTGHDRGTWSESGWPVLHRCVETDVLLEVIGQVAREQELAAHRPVSARTVREKSDGALVAVWGTHGAPGRSTVAAYLAHALGERKGSILIDADMQAPSSVPMLGIVDGDGAMAVAAQRVVRGIADSESFEQLLIDIGPGRRLLTGLGQHDHWCDVPALAMEEICRLATAITPWTVVDLAGGPVEDENDDDTYGDAGREDITAVARCVLRMADVVVLVGRSDPVGIVRLLRLYEDARASGMYAGRDVVVVNGVHDAVAGKSAHRQVCEVMREAGIEDSICIPHDWSIPAAVMRGSVPCAAVLAEPVVSALTAVVARVDAERAECSAGEQDVTHAPRRRWRWHR